MKFSIKDSFSKCDQIRSFLRIWSHIRKKSLMETSFFVQWKISDQLASQVISSTRVSSEAVVRNRSVKKVFFEILQNSHENTFARVCFLIKLQASGLQLY